MRQRVECDGRYASYALRVEADGVALRTAVVRGGGLRHDRSLFVLEEFDIAPGVHRVHVSFARREAPGRPDSDDATARAVSVADGDTGLFAGRARREAMERARRARVAIPPRLDFDTVLAFAADRVIIISLDPERRALRTNSGP